MCPAVARDLRPVGCGLRWRAPRALLLRSLLGRLPLRLPLAAELLLELRVGRAEPLDLLGAATVDRRPAHPLPFARPARPGCLPGGFSGRLQTFPDDFEFIGGKESVRKQIGMAVPVEGVKVIVEAVLKSFAGIEYEHTEPNIKVKNTHNLFKVLMEPEVEQE